MAVADLWETTQRAASSKDNKKFLEEQFLRKLQQKFN